MSLLEPDLPTLGTGLFRATVFLSLLRGCFRSFPSLSSPWLSASRMILSILLVFCTASLLEPNSCASNCLISLSSCSVSGRRCLCAARRARLRLTLRSPNWVSGVVCSAQAASRRCRQLSCASWSKKRALQCTSNLQTQIASGRVNLRRLPSCSSSNSCRKPLSSWSTALLMAPSSSANILNLKILVRLVSPTSIPSISLTLSAVSAAVPAFSASRMGPRSQSTTSGSTLSPTAYCSLASSSCLRLGRVGSSGPPNCTSFRYSVSSSVVCWASKSMSLSATRTASLWLPSLR